MSHVGYQLENKNRYLLRDINLELYPGEWVCVIGRSGSGKTTLGRMCAGLLPPTHGSSLCHAERVGWVAQNPTDTLLGATVFDDVAFGLHNAGLTGRQLEERVRKALSSVGMAEDLLDRDPLSLSGGERQRVALAGVLALSPQLLILDEPTSMVDQYTATQIHTAIRTARQSGCSVLHITHSLHEATRADRIIVLVDGQIVGNGPSASILANKELLISAGAAIDTNSVSTIFLQADRTYNAICCLAERVDHITIETQSVCYNYNSNGQNIPALRDINVAVQAGTRIALLGEPGSGKSTLLQVMADLLPPSRGKVLYNGRAVAERRQKQELRCRIGLGLQQPEDQFFAASVWHEVTYAPQNLGLKTPLVKQLATAALIMVGLDPTFYGPRSPFSLSGGERRRVALASILAVGPSLLLLDEPLAGLDLATGTEIWQVVDCYLSQSGAACIAATHDAAWAQDWADTTMQLTNGKQQIGGVG